MKISELLTDESKWTKGSFAKDVNGQTIRIGSSKACRWCLLGAVMITIKVECEDAVVAKLRNTINKLFPNMTGFSLTQFNDHHDTTFDMIRAIIEDAGV